MKVLIRKEADVFLKRLSMKLAKIWHRPYSKNRCLRGSRIPTGRISHGVDWEDGVG